MRRILLLITLLASVASQAQVSIDENNFPDENFRNYLLSQSYGVDSVITESELLGITELDVQERGITTLQGIELFTNLRYLLCWGNELNTLDVSNNTKLKTLACGDNHLTELDVSKCPNIEVLWCYRNQLEELDVSSLSKLEILSCHWNSLRELDLTNCTSLIGVSCHNNQLESLKVAGLRDIEDIYCFRNNLTSLDLTDCNSLDYVYMHENSIHGSAMDEMISTLPRINYGSYLVVININSDAGDNVCTKDQVSLINDKGWKVMYSDGIGNNERGSVYLYEGSEPTGIANYVPAGNKDAVYYGINGACGKYPIHGLNIIRKADGSVSKRIIK